MNGIAKGYTIQIGLIIVFTKNIKYPDMATWGSGPLQKFFCLERKISDSAKKFGLYPIRNDSDCPWII